MKISRNLKVYLTFIGRLNTMFQLYDLTEHSININAKHSYYEIIFELYSSI